MNEGIPTPKRVIVHHRAMLLAARPIPVPFISAVAAVLLMFDVQSGQAGSATWLAAPVSGNWTNAANWTSGGPPNGPSDNATFATSSQTTVFQPADVQVGRVIFSSGADAFTITTRKTFRFTISGTGITNNSVAAENFVAAGATVASTNGGQIIFQNSATAANAIFTNNAATIDGATGGSTQFFGNASAGHGNFTNVDGISSDSAGGFTEFRGNSSAANGTFTNNAGAGGAVFPLAGGTAFYDTATAGNATITNGGVDAGCTQFNNSSTAGSSHIMNEPGIAPNYGRTVFVDNSSAGSSVITTVGPTVNGGDGGYITFFYGSPSAANATFINNGATAGDALGGLTELSVGTAANATFIANGGTNGGGGGRIEFTNSLDGGTARVEVFGNGLFDLFNFVGNMTIGSLEGDGLVYLGYDGPNQLAIGSNNLSTTFSGVIQDGDYIGGINSYAMGSIAKVGAGTLSLTNANTYTGGTTVSGGTLLAAHNSALATGDVSVGAGATLQLQNGATNNYIFDGAALRIVTNSIVNLNYSGTPDVVGSLFLNGVSQIPGVWGGPTSGAPHQLPQFTGPGTILVTTSVAVSRNIQGAGTFDIPLPFTGPSGIECRSGGASNNYQIVVTFGSPVTFASASVTSGVGMVMSTSGNGTSTITINLAGVTNAQRLVVTVFSVNYGPATGNLPIRMGMLLGDTNGNSTVNAADVAQTKGRLGQAVDGTNFRSDVNANGSINAADTAIIKQNSGTSLPP